MERPKLDTLTEDIGDAIGHREVNRLWAIRYHCAMLSYDDSFVGDVLPEKFKEELAGLSARELSKDYRSIAEVERDRRDAEQRAFREEAREAEADEWEQAQPEAQRICREERKVSETADMKEPKADGAATKVEPPTEFAEVKYTTAQPKLDSRPEPPTTEDTPRLIIAGEATQAGGKQQREDVYDIELDANIRTALKALRAARSMRKAQKARATAEAVEAGSDLQAKEEEDAQKVMEESGEAGEAMEEVNYSEEFGQPEEEESRSLRDVRNGISEDSHLERGQIGLLASKDVGTVPEAAPGDTNGGVHATEEKGPEANADTVISLLEDQAHGMIESTEGTTKQSATGGVPQASSHDQLPKEPSISTECSLDAKARKALKKSGKKKAKKAFYHRVEVEAAMKSKAGGNDEAGLAEGRRGAHILKAEDSNSIPPPFPFKSTPGHPVSPTADRGAAWDNPRARRSSCPVAMPQRTSFDSKAWRGDTPTTSSRRQSLRQGGKIELQLPLLVLAKSMGLTSP